ncbi:MAG TPA: S8 family serine peptidase [Kofleriaceae bacterium]|nr:S8 family serine peptidase [Kofleriaceae bacterium]
MKFAHPMFSKRSIFTLAFGTLAFASCVSSEPGNTGSDDPQTDDTDVPTTNVCSGGHWTCKSHVQVDEHNRIRPFATPSGLGPADLTSAYKLNSAITSTATIAIVDAFNYPNAESDLAKYRSQFGLSACTKANGCLQILNQSGAASPLPGKAPAGDDWTVEAALDLDMASAACPTCKLILFEAQDDEGDGLFIAQNAAAAAGAVSISNSWGGPSDGTDLTLDSQYFTHTQAVNVFVASGDSGNTGKKPDYPSTSAKVIGVGGTHLVKASNARGWTETVWNGAGSSCSKVIPKPGFQSVVPASACANRAASDVSSVADPNTGVAVYNAGSGGFIVVGGTSAASPFVAGVYARYGISGASHDASYAYSHTTQFFDITSGKNGTCGAPLCKSGAGWDGPTGIGSPNGAAL